MFILAKQREPNVKIVRISTNGKTEVNGDSPANGSQPTADSEATGARKFVIRRLYSSSKPLPKSNHCFIRPEESFLSLGRGPVILSAAAASSSLPEWAQSLLPPPPTTPLFRRQEVTSAEIKEEPSLENTSSPSPSTKDELLMETPSKVTPVEGGAKKAMRFTCRTCSERLPTLNSLRTHLKSHCRPLVQHQTPQLSQHSICMQAQVVTSKYGRRRSVISAKSVPPSRANKGANTL